MKLGTLKYICQKWMFLPQWWEGYLLHSLIFSHSLHIFKDFKHKWQILLSSQKYLSLRSEYFFLPGLKLELSLSMYVPYMDNLTNRNGSCLKKKRVEIRHNKKIQHACSLHGQFNKWKWIVSLKKKSRDQAIGEGPGQGGDFIPLMGSRGG